MESDKTDKVMPSFEVEEPPTKKRAVRKKKYDDFDSDISDSERISILDRKFRKSTMINYILFFLLLCASYVAYDSAPGTHRHSYYRFADKDHSHREYADEDHGHWGYAEEDHRHRWEHRH